MLLRGVLIGPHVLGVAETSNIQLLANIGLGFLFLLTGYELDPGLLLVVRGLPSLLVYRRSLATRQRVEMTFITATTLPLLIALVEVGQRDGVMLPANAAALVGAGVLSVLVYPLIAVMPIAAEEPHPGTGRR